MVSQYPACYRGSQRRQHTGRTHVVWRHVSDTKTSGGAPIFPRISVTPRGKLHLVGPQESVQEAGAGPRSG